MSTPYEQLKDLARRATEVTKGRREAAAGVAMIIRDDIVQKLGVPEAVQASLTPAVTLCKVSIDGRSAPERIATDDTESLITSNDGEEYWFGIIVQIRSRNAPPYSAVFRVQLFHKLNDRFDVRLAGLEPFELSASGQTSPLLSSFTDHIYNRVRAYFEASVRGDLKKKPEGFQIIVEDD